MEGRMLIGGPGGKDSVRILSPGRSVRDTLGLRLHAASTALKIVSFLTLSTSMAPISGISRDGGAPGGAIDFVSSIETTIPHPPPSEASALSSSTPVTAANCAGKP